MGKLGIPDAVLHKPDKLTDAEWEVMRKHPQFAYDMLYPIQYLREQSGRHFDPQVVDLFFKVVEAG